MPENTPGFTPSAVAIPPYTLVGGPENIKLLFDEELDDRRENRARSRAWEAVTLLQQQNLVAIQQNNAAFFHAVNMGSLLSAQAGTTAQQQTVSPIRTAAADTEVQQPAGAVYPPIRNVDQGGATATNVVQTAMEGVAVAAEGVSTANQSIADAVANLMNALTSVIVNASGGASTPSQTQPKPAA